MPVHLKNIPPAAERPAVPEMSRWFSFLGGLTVIGTAAGIYLDKQAEGTRFWLLAPAALCIVWLVVFMLRLLVWASLDLRAIGWDRAREEVLLHETRRGRRALQILHTGIVLPLPDTETRPPATVLMEDVSLLKRGPDRAGKQLARHAHFAIADYLLDRPGKEVEIVTQFHVETLLLDVATRLDAFPPEQAVAVLLENSTTIPPDTLRRLWDNSVKAAGIRQQLVPVDGGGPGFIDHWLDERFEEKTLLLIVALQVEPEEIADTGEAFVALLLGNRLTQETLAPLALLHRPERTTPATASEDIRQAADWVPVEDGAIKHLWTSGLSDAQANAVQTVAHTPVLAGVDFASSRYVTDDIMGKTGAVTPWLAVAAAAQASRKTRLPQMVITAGPDGDAFWSQVISPL